MKRIAVIFEGNIDQRYGVFNAVVNRVKYLRGVSDFQIDIFMIQVYDKWLTRKFRNSRSVAKGPATIVEDGETIKMWWVSRDFVDAVLHRTLGSKPLKLLSKLNRLADQLKDYDIVTAHDMLPAHVAWSASKKFHIPFFVTWHGASIYTAPVHDKMVKSLTRNLVNKADCNFFVTQRLAEYASKLFATDIKYQVLLNGAADTFVRYSDEERASLREKHGVNGKKVVTFAARFAQEKNVLLLPDIFKAIKEKYEGEVQFWAFGEGTLKNKVKAAIKACGVDCKFWGNQPPTSMPEYLNCTDVLVLPSILEAMPLITIEALSCGANAVGSDVMGIASAIGQDNVVDLADSEFVEKFSNRAVEMLCGSIEQTLPPDCSWLATAKKEHEIYNNY